MAMRWPVIAGLTLLALTAGAVALRRTDASPVVRSVLSATFPRAVVVDERQGRAYVIGSDRADRHIWGLDTATGQVLLTVPTADTPGGVALDARHARLFVGNGTSSTVSMYDATSGVLLHTISVGGWRQDGTTFMGRELAVSEPTGRVFVANSGSNTVSVLDAQTGRIVRTVHVGRNPAALAVDSRAGRVVVVNSARPYLFPDQAGGAHGSVSILDAGSGSVRATIPVGVAPDAVAVDESTGRAFVVNSGAGRQVPVTDAWAWLPNWLRTHIPFLAAGPARGRTVPAGSVSVLNITR